MVRVISLKRVIDKLITGDTMKSTRVIRYLFLALLILAIPASLFAGVFISVGIAPPALPVYVQPACPGDGYIWTPGYWAYGPEGYFWVPGTWVMAPEPGLLWTPGYWGWGESAYIWHAGYWGPHIGFYGGINYGFGYFGSGYEGGYWRDRHFFYNRSVNNVNITNVHIYNKTVINNVTVNRVAYNGGHGGINARPSHFEEVAVRERHFEPTHVQMEHEHGAGRNRKFLASQNHGRPAIAATARPGEFNNHGGRENRGGNSYRPSENRPEHRGQENRAVENRGAPRPENNVRNDQRAMMRQDTRPETMRQDSRNYRGEQQMRNAPRQESRPHYDAAPRGNAARAENARPHENGGGQRQPERDHGHGPR